MCDKMELIDLYNLFASYPPALREQVRRDFATRNVPTGDAFALPGLDGVFLRGYFQPGHTVYYTVVVDEFQFSRRTRHSFVFEFEVK